MKTSSTNKKIREIITMVKDGTLVPKPDFQRRLVWSRDDKNRFIETILSQFPFPEIYLSNGDVDLETGRGTQLLVDGLQRVTTICQYFNEDPSLKLTSVSTYKNLSTAEKTAFLEYDISVRDLGNLDRDQIVEVFKRLNATKYGLRDIEINNAYYSGPLKQYADELSSHPFFVDHNVYTSLDYKRMGDLGFAVLLVSTFISGYFNRDEKFEEILSRYNDDFLIKNDINNRIVNVMRFIDECGFELSSRIWNKNDLFTIMVELDLLINKEQIKIDPYDTLNIINKFYKEVGEAVIEWVDIAAIYKKSVIQASNDKINRLRRGIIIRGLIRKESPQVIIETLEKNGLK